MSCAGSKSNRAVIRTLSLDLLEGRTRLPEAGRGRVDCRVHCVYLWCIFLVLDFVYSLLKLFIYLVCVCARTHAHGCERSLTCACAHCRTGVKARG